MRQYLRLVLCSLALALLGIALATVPARAGEITVCPPGTGPCDYHTVQAAVDASAPGDVIKIAAGTYTDTLNRAAPPGYDGPAMVKQVAHITQSLTLRGGYTTTNGFAEPPDPAANPTTLDPQQQGRGILVAGEISVTIAGLRVINGYADGLNGGVYGYDAGGGIYVVTATIALGDNTIANNSSSQYGQHNGGGAFFYNSTLTLQGNTFSANRADDGVGVYLYQSQGLFQNNVFVANVGGWHGGGIYARYSDIVLEGDTFDSNGADFGGGLSLVISSATISDSVFIANHADYGGAVHANSNSLVFYGNRLDQNRAQEQGGGLYLESGYAEITGNTIAANDAQSNGGGIYAQSISGRIDHNTVMSNTSDGYGGGVFVLFGDLRIAYNTIRDNTASTGGGMHIVSAHEAVLDGNRVLGNTATYGGGLGLAVSNTTLQNNVIADNYARSRASGIYVRGSSPRLWHNTLARNHGSEGSALYVAHEIGTMGKTSVVQASNTILISHTLGITVTAGNTATLEATVWGNASDWGGPGTIVTGTHNWWGNPDFVDPDEGDYHIDSDSIACDAGVDAGVDHDMDGEVRPVNGAYDIGADEYPAVGLRLTQTPDAEQVNLGEALVYVLHLTSAGVNPATHVVLTDSLDIWQRPLSVTASVAGCALENTDWGGDILCSLGDLAPGAEVIITLTAQISSTTPMGQEIDSVALARSNETFAEVRTTNAAQDCYIRLNADPVTYRSVQSAVEAADTGDWVKVAGYCVGVHEHLAPMGYSGAGIVKQLLYLDKTITLQGGYTADFNGAPDPIANPTTLDALGQGRVLFIAGDISPTISGFNLVNGNAAGLGGYAVGGSGLYDAGGGVYAKAWATLRESVLMNHQAQYGGGVFWSGGELRLHNNQFLTNTASFDGGGAYLATYATLTGNRFAANRAGDDGGGIVLGVYWDATLEGNTFEANGAANRGGGAFLFYGYAAINKNTVISNSAALDGGGMFLYSSEASLQGNVIISNSATHDGGGLYVRRGVVQLSDNAMRTNRADRGGGVYLNSSAVVLTNTLLVENWGETAGSGVYVRQSSPRLLHTTVARNRGGDGSGLFFEGSSGRATLVNSIIVSQTVGITVTAGQMVDLDATLWGTGVWANKVDWGGAGTVVTGTINVWGDPAFIAPDAGDYHIEDSGAAIDVGVDAGVTHDIDGDPRPHGDGFDLGADETTFKVALALAPDRSSAVAPGNTAVYTHTVTNHGDLADVVSLAAHNTRGWPVMLHGGAWLTGTAQLPLPLEPGASACVTASVAVPATATPGLTATTVLTATSANDPAIHATARDVTAVAGPPSQPLFLPLVLREAP